MPAPRKYDQETRDRAARMYQERRRDSPNESALQSRRRVGGLLDVRHDTLRGWVERVEIDAGCSLRSGAAADTRPRLPSGGGSHDDRSVADGRGRLRVAEMAVDRSPAHTEYPGDGLDGVLPRLVHLAGGAHLVGRHDRRPAAVAAWDLASIRPALVRSWISSPSNSARAPRRGTRACRPKGCGLMTNGSAALHAPGGQLVPLAPRR